MYEIDKFYFKYLLLLLEEIGMKKQKVLVTGGCGFIGSRIVKKLLEKDFEVHVIDDLSTGNISNIPLDQVEFFHIDILHNDLEDLFSKFQYDYVIHQAAQTSVAFSVENIKTDAKINILGSINLIDLAIKYKVKKFIFASSAAVYGHPNELPITESHNTVPSSPYGLSKLTIEKYLDLAHDLYGLSYIILRYSNVFGPKQTAKGEGGVVSIFNECLKNNERPIIYGDGNQTRDFIFVDDVAEANIAAIYSNVSGIYNISSNEQISINKLLSIMNDISGKNLKPIFDSPRVGDIRDSLLSNDKANQHLMWKPKISLYDGLKMTLTIY